MDLCTAIKKSYSTGDQIFFDILNLKTIIRDFIKSGSTADIIIATDKNFLQTKIAAAATKYVITDPTELTKLNAITYQMMIDCGSDYGITAADLPNTKVKNGEINPTDTIYIPNSYIGKTLAETTMAGIDRPNAAAITAYTMSNILGRNNITIFIAAVLFVILIIISVIIILIIKNKTKNNKIENKNNTNKNNTNKNNTNKK